MSVYFAHAEGHASLDEIMGAADALNHAIPTTTELSGALTRLAKCGVVTQGNDRFRIVGEFLPMIAKANQGKGGLFSTPDKGKKWLSQVTFELNDAPCVTITEEQLSAAYIQYRNACGNNNSC